MPNNKLFNIVLYAPDIPGNTGSIGRTCLALGLKLILIKPYGFELSEKAVRRAGLDYWKYVDLEEYETWDKFYADTSPKPEQLHFFSGRSEKSYFQAIFNKGDYLIFGCETSGLPKHIFKSFPQNMLTLPMNSEHIRSLNLSNAATAAAYEALRQING